MSTSLPSNPYYIIPHFDNIVLAPTPSNNPHIVISTNDQLIPKVTSAAPSAHLVPSSSDFNISSYNVHASSNFNLVPEPSTSIQFLPNRKSTRPSYPPSYLVDYHYMQTSTLPHPSSSYKSYRKSTRPSHPPSYPISSILFYNNCSTSYKYLCCPISSNHEPKIFLQTNKPDCWKQAMNAELQALVNNNIWSLVDLPPGKVPIGCIWVYKIKYNSNGCIDR